MDLNALERRVLVAAVVHLRIRKMVPSHLLAVDSFIQTSHSAAQGALKLQAVGGKVQQALGTIIRIHLISMTQRQ